MDTLGHLATLVPQHSQQELDYQMPEVQTQLTLLLMLINHFRLKHKPVLLANFGILPLTAI